VIYAGGLLSCAVAILRTHGLEGPLAALAALALGFAGFYFVAARAAYRPSGWALGLVAICVGVTGFLFPFTVPLLVFWMRPETKAAFGRL